ncbi:MAG: diacylglycerol kinase family protein [Chitinophagaceae bacterium]|nr:diacylglycerol kinase family protein [Chitinophagaceae bacterium]MBK8310033.1 diacylglycerol kinase family protein [Chitinophagaceae bacterium]MBK8607159.1 diacylglycerol kinase family protein [Chitinophagaceae bacterium]MBP6478913.1 diacylglycerol kinase family protein [Chitinophagaceae bacterium]HQV54346.1 diacylglycerol kinase family protein [Chitinophagaceae bacterium]
MNDEPFSIKARTKSFKYAFSGIRDFIIREHNARLHLAATVVVIVIAILLKVNYAEAILLTIVTGLVWICELINTAIEKVIDFITFEKLPPIKYIKDVAAAAVLVAAIVALITGCLIFIPKI